MPQPAPSSQQNQACPISFVLVDNSNPAGSILPTNTVTLYIRPEDLTRSDTSRINPQQTLGGLIWADNFGPGLPTIQISGHTGWRKPPDPAQGTLDGVARFKQLKNQVFTNWHARRQVAIQNGKDPDQTVQLQFVDTLNSIAAVVAPLSFVLRRSRARPLLYMYQISMVVWQDNIAVPASAQPKLASNTVTALTTQQTITAGITSLTTSINNITQQIKNVSQYVNQNIATPVAQFMMTTGTLLTAVNNAVSSVQGVTASLISVAQLTTQAGVNIFRSLAAVANLPTLIKGQLMDIAGAFSNALCVLSNAFTQQLQYPNYTPLYGSSNCSSTNGGVPPTIFEGLNPFQYTNPQQTPDAVTMTPQAQSALTLMAKTDIINNPPSTATIGSTCSTAAAGLVSTNTAAAA